MSLLEFYQLSDEGCLLTMAVTHILIAAALYFLFAYTTVGFARQFICERKFLERNLSPAALLCLSLACSAVWPLFVATVMVFDLFVAREKED